MAPQKKKNDRHFFAYLNAYYRKGGQINYKIRKQEILGNCFYLKMISKLALQ